MRAVSSLGKVTFSRTPEGRQLLDPAVAKSEPAGERPLYQAEEDLTLVLKVAEEGGLPQLSALSDVDHGRVVVAALGEEVEGRLREPLTGVWFPTGHGHIVETWFRHTLE